MTGDKKIEKAAEQAVAPTLDKINAEIERDVPQHVSADEKAQRAAKIMRKHGVKVDERKLRRESGG